MRAAIYARVSTKDQSTDLQKERLTKYCESRGWTFTVYDDCISGATYDRPDLARLLADARKRKIDVVVCWKLDRLFRSLRHLVTTLQEFNDLGIQFVCVEDQIDMTTASGRLMTHLIAAFGEFEREMITERIRAGVRRKIAKNNGKWGRPSTLNKEKALRLRSEGHSIRTIAKALNCAASSVHAALKD